MRTHTSLFIVSIFSLVLAASCAQVAPPKPTCQPGEQLFLCNYQVFRKGDSTCLLDKQKYFCAPSYSAVLDKIGTVINNCAGLLPDCELRYDCLRENTGPGSQPNGWDDESTAAVSEALGGTDPDGWSGGSCSADVSMGGSVDATDPTATMCQAAIDPNNACQVCAGENCCPAYQGCQNDANCQCWIECEAAGHTVSECEADVCGPQEFVTGQLAGCLLGFCTPQCGETPPEPPPEPGSPAPEASRAALGRLSRR